MIPVLRRAFNAAFDERLYRDYRAELEAVAGCPVEFRLAETPIFLPPALRDEIVSAGLEICALLSSADHATYSLAAVPPVFDVPACDAHPQLIQVDFALVREDDRIVPRLIELQGFPSLYAFQLFQAEAWRRRVPDGGRLRHLLGGLEREDYIDLLGRILLGEHAPDEVVLLELDPLRQKTLVDFRFTERLWGIPAVDASSVERRGRELWHRREGRWRRIRRVYNRIVVDELVARGVELPFRYTDDLDIEWAGHPNWFFRWSKHSLPWLRHPAVPEAVLLSSLAGPPADLDHWVLKPLFAFAGSGVKVSVTPEDVGAIPAERRSHTMLMRKVEYEPVIETVDGLRSKAEVRLMLAWPLDDPSPTPVTTLVRLSQGAMMGVDFNRDRTWVGSTIALWPEDRD
jgi:hypothetical protein